jgi:outer membrane cobalamin receptor
MIYRSIITAIIGLLIGLSGYANSREGVLVGQVSSTEGEVLDYATVVLKGTNRHAYTDDKGSYSITVPAGDYTVVFSMAGFTQEEHSIKIKSGSRTVCDAKLKPVAQLAEVEVVGNAVSKVKGSAYNAVALNTQELENTTKTLSDALDKAPGMKVRESGGVGSDMAITMDGFTGKHVKVFIDGAPQENIGGSFGLNNIPVNYADRIEIYRGVVPVGFGTDAIGGVVNIVTKRRPRSWFVDASYSFGSFNTHRSYINAGQTLKSGFKYEINLFQNYSDNNYSVDASVEDFTTGAINRKVTEHVKRFNDTYHNEAVSGKFGWVHKSWADRLLVGLTYSHVYKEIQTGVRQEIVYGGKHRHGHSLMSSLEYSKHNLLTDGLDLSFNANYTNEITVNVDTASYKYNWRGEKDLLNSPGEQSYQNNRANNNNWTASLTANYRLGDKHVFTFNDVFNAFNRLNKSLLTTPPTEDEFSKITNKNILGVSYRYVPIQSVNLSVFAKHYNQYISGPVATSSAQDAYVRTSRKVNSIGYGAAGTYFMPYGMQLKLSYEKAYRLPTIEEMFGDEDLETGDITLKPESSHNVNLNLSYNTTLGDHALYAEGGLIYRDTRDYIQRNIMSLSGGKSAATYINYGKVLTKGVNVSLRYSYSHWVSVGGNFTYMNAADNMPTASGSSVANLSYKERLPNLPYLFADSDISFYWRNLFKKGNMLTVTYDNQYTHSFCYYSSNIGTNKSEYMVPNQFAHNFTFTYALQHGRYNFSLECRNITDARLYDNFSLQKAGRAFYVKVRVNFSSK